MADELAKYDPNQKYPYEKLKGKDNCPTGVDPSNKEVIIICVCYDYGTETW